MQTWVPWSEASGTARGTIEEFRGLLKRYKRSSLLIACSRLSVLFNFGLDGEVAAPAEVVARWVPLFFAPQIASRVLLLAQQERLIFFQAQLRYLAREVMRLENVSEEHLPPVHDSVLGELLFRAGELLYTPYVNVSDPMDELVNKIVTFLPYYEIDGVNAPPMQFLRFYILLEVIVPRLADHLKLYDVPKLFEEQFRFPLKEYCEFIFCFFMHATTQRDQKTLEAAVDSAVGIKTFRYTSVSPDAIKRMFDKVCFSLDTFEVKKEPVGFADFDLLKDTPYLLHHEELFCLDYEFAGGKIESGALWRVMRGFENHNERTKYLSFWGHVFEEYVRWLFEKYAPQERNMFYASPSYSDDPSKQICDAIVVCDGAAVLIEAKLATCPSDIRYSGDYRKMKEFLEDRLVVGKKGAVGVRQLRNALDNIAAGSSSALPTWLQGIRKFIPLIITRDDLASSWEVNEYLNARFQDERKRHKRYTITPLVSMSIGTLERSLHALREHSFVEILEDRLKSKRAVGWSFEAASSYVPRGRAISMSAHLEVFKQLTKDVIADFHMRDPDVGERADPP
jgi:hypothetical protein